VATATSAAAGTLTPQPCMPCTASPWSPGLSDITLCGIKVLDDASTLTCAWTGTITVTDAGQQTDYVP
jgi:hypothetical protein